MKTVDVFSHLNDLMGVDGNNSDFLELERIEEERELEQKVKGSFERRLLWKQMKQNMKEFAEENGFRFVDTITPTGSAIVNYFCVNADYDGDLFRVFDKMTGEGILDSDGALLGDRLFKHISEFNDRGLAVVEDWKNGLAVISSDFDLLCEWGVSPALANIIMRGDE